MRFAMLATLLSGLAVSAPARDMIAQTTPPGTGFALSVRGTGGAIQDLAASAAGAPQFTIGYRGERYSVGVGVGFITARASDKDEFTGGSSEEKTTATAFQLGPAVRMELWRSPDRRTLGNLAAGLSIGRLSLTDEDTFSDQSGTQTTKTESSGTLVSFHAALGGDHFLSSHFALGLEAGLQGTIAFGIEEEGNGQRLGASASGAYGGLRITLVF